MQDLGSWDVRAYDWVYVWPRGEYVHIYTDEGYRDRLCGGHARPHTILHLSSKFASRRDFYVWAVGHRAHALEQMFFPVRVDRARAIERAQER